MLCHDISEMYFKFIFLIYKNEKFEKIVNTNKKLGQIKKVVQETPPT